MARQANCGQQHAGAGGPATYGSNGEAPGGCMPGFALRVWVYLPRTTSIPESTSSSLASGSLATRLVRRSLSTLTIWDTFATESFGRLVRCAGSDTFPGAPAHLRLLISGMHTTVAMRLRFNASPCTTTTGLRNPGPEPAGAGRSAHQTSPCEITTRFAPECGGRQRKRTYLSNLLFWHRPGSSHPLPPPVRGAPHTP